MKEYTILYFQILLQFQLSLGESTLMFMILPVHIQYFHQIVKNFTESPRVFKKVKKDFLKMV